jgi:hypothetical protein
MSKILIGAGAAALWLMLAHVASANGLCRQVGDIGTCSSHIGFSSPGLQIGIGR